MTLAALAAQQPTPSWAEGAAWSMTGSDKAMLVRTTDLIGNYIKDNYAAVVDRLAKRDEKQHQKADR